MNASAQATLALRDATILGRRVTVAHLPVRFGDARRALERAVRRADPELVVCVGEAGGRAEIAVERVAINVDDARIPDNGGAQPVDRAVVRRGPVGYWSTLPIKAIVAALRDAGIPAVISQSAGTFVCNHVFYALMHLLARRPNVRGGFLHVPHLPEQVAAARASTPSMTVDLVSQALALAIATSLKRRRDLRVVGGGLHG